MKTKSNHGRWAFAPLFLLVSSLALGTACASGGGSALGGYFGADAFQLQGAHLAIAYSDPRNRKVMGDQWQLSNYRRKAGGTYQEKRGPKYETTLALDNDGDGRNETRVKVPLHDLLLSHSQTSATVWLQTLVLDEELKNKELKLLLFRYIQSIAAPTDVVQQTGRSFTVSRERGYKTRLLNRTKARLGDAEALAATYELSSVLNGNDSDGNWQRSKVVLIRLDQRVFVGGHARPILVVLGFSALPGDFEKHLSEFTALLGRMSKPSHKERLALLQGERKCDVREGTLTLKLDSNGRAVVKSKSSDFASKQLEICWNRRVKGMFFAGGPVHIDFSTKELGPPKVRPSYQESPKAESTDDDTKAI